MASKDGVTLLTGPLKLEVSKKRFRLLDRVWLDRNGDGRFSAEERITASQGAGIELTTPDGKKFQADLGHARCRLSSWDR